VQRIYCFLPLLAMDGKLVIAIDSSSRPVAAGLLRLQKKASSAALEQQHRRLPLKEVK